MGAANAIAGLCVRMLDRHLNSLVSTGRKATCVSSRAVVKRAFLQILIHFMQSAPPHSQPSSKARPQNILGGCGIGYSVAKGRILADLVSWSENRGGSLADSGLLLVLFCLWKVLQQNMQSYKWVSISSC